MTVGEARGRVLHLVRISGRMATIFYSVMGEGRGHASRARAMAEQLCAQHRVIIYTSYDALKFLRDCYDGEPKVEVRETSGLKFHYQGNRLNLSKTVSRGLQFRWHLEEQLQRLKRDFEQDRPDVVVADFEPTVPRAARRAGVPVMSLDHQHFIVGYDLSSLPWQLRLHARLMQPAIWAFGIGQQKTVVSAFYYPPLRPGYEDYVQVGPLLRPFARQIEPRTDEHLLCYLRRTTPQRVIDMVCELDRPVRIYGLGGRADAGQAIFCEINEQRFVEDLATSAGVIAASGNQLSGEAMYFRKPFLAIPEAKHYEQRINAHFLEQIGGSRQVLLEKLKLQDLQDFLANLETLRERLAQSTLSFDGTGAAAREIEAFIDESRS